MKTNRVFAAVASLIRAKDALAKREQVLIAELNRVLPSMGYRVISEADRNGPIRQATRGPARIRKTLVCPHCDRTFGHPLHLGRHVSAMHSMDGTRRSRTRARAKVQARQRRGVTKARR